jgi:hypothetical protein
VRGRPAVFHALYLKVAGWNLLRLLLQANCEAEWPVGWLRAIKITDGPWIEVVDGKTVS